MSMVQIKFIVTQEVELVDGETECPRDVSPVDGRGVGFLWGFFGFLSAGVRHGIVFNLLSEWARL